jgi:hypothetical protein
MDNQHQQLCQGSADASNASERTVEAANTGNSLNEPEAEELQRIATAPPQADNSMNSTASVSAGLALLEDLFGSLEIESPHRRNKDT